MGAEKQNEIWVDSSFSGAWSDCDQGEGWERFVRAGWITEILAANKGFSREEKLAIELLSWAKDASAKIVVLKKAYGITRGFYGRELDEAADALFSLLPSNSKC